MTGGYLFSGIGGFELASIWAGIELVWSNEIDQYCCDVLRKNFDHDIIEESILNIDYDELKKVDIICGGFPCQPFSTAGKRGGTRDNRYLWPAMLEVIRNVGPKYVVGENVAGILSMDGGKVYDEICTSLEVLGYKVESFIVPAISVGAPHRRDRVWIIAYTDDDDDQGGLEQRAINEETRGSKASNIKERGILHGKRIWPELGGCDLDTADSAIKRSQRKGRHGIGISTESDKERKANFAFYDNWKQEHWTQVATRICRVDDGIPAGVDGTGQVPTKPKKAGRKHRLKALGNAIVPQVAYQILKAIKEYESYHCRER